jgi:hypothetical protein
MIEKENSYSTTGHTPAPDFSDYLSFNIKLQNYTKLKLTITWNKM